MPFRPVPRPASESDPDGRGHLSDEALVEITRYFLDVCIDQIGFTEELMRSRELRARIMAQPLVEAGLIRAATTRASYMLAFPAEFAPCLMPGLYPGTAR